jgi:hypothetical protein
MDINKNTTMNIDRACWLKNLDNMRITSALNEKKLGTDLWRCGIGAQKHQSVNIFQSWEKRL